MKDKDFPKEGKLKFKSLLEVKEIKSLLEGGASPVKQKPAPSKGVTPQVTTAATSRNTQSPTRRPTKREDSSEVRRPERSQPLASQRKPSVGKSSVHQTPQVPKPLKSAYKGRFG
jgi:hypothetical protein